MTFTRKLAAMTVVALAPLSAAQAGETPFLGIAGERAIEAELAGSDTRSALNIGQGDPYSEISRTRKSAHAVLPVRDARITFWPSTIHQARRARETRGTGLNPLNSLF